jgi:chromate transporter
MEAAASHSPTLGELTRVFTRIGLLSFGGPAGQIALMHSELVDRRQWISDARFLHALNFCMLLPGPEAQQLATYIGWLLHGTRGGLIAGTLFVLPGLAVILSLSTAYALFSDTDWLTSLFFGVKAAILAVVVEALIRVGRRALKTRALQTIAAAAFLALFAFALPFPLVIAAAGLMGLVGTHWRPDLFPAGGHAGSDDVDETAIGRMDPTAAPTLSRAVKVLLAGAAAWVAPVVLVALALGGSSIFLPLAAFFSKMAVVTFGGAYAVLAYVAQQAVEAYGWLRPGEMLDGLALAETTPGPLILVLTFVGFIAALRQPGVLDPLTAGLLGALITTWVTFVPCFLWIFLGAPYMERLRGNRSLAGALSAITAAVVGVILNLTVWFATHVLFGEVRTVRAGPIEANLPVMSSIDVAALALAAVAMIAMFRLKLGIVLTLAICGAAGIALRLAGWAT